MAANATLVELILRWEQAKEDGKPITPDELCADNPDYLPVLQRHLQQLEDFEKLRDPHQTVADRFTHPAVVPDIPGYEVLREIEGGGMGVVFEARYLALDQHRAVKVIRAGADAGPHHLQRFEREAKVLAKLEHDHIVTVHEARLHEGNPFLIMPFIRGGSLQSRLDQYRRNPPAAVQLVETVARAVHYAHDQGIIHRDLKPGNILISEDNKPLVSDFGIAMLLHARWAEEEAAAPRGAEDTVTMATRITRAGVAMGTLPYMAPEQVNGELKAIDRTTDIWALGVILHLLLLGERPFRAKEQGELVRQITTADLTKLRSKAKQIDRSLANIVVKCLQAKPCDRYQTAEALAHDLNAWHNGKGYKLETRRRWATRQAKRWALPTVAATAVLVILGLVVANSMTPPEEVPYQEYEEYAEKIAERLKRGESVTLVGPGVAKPVYWERFGGGTKIRVIDGKEGKEIQFDCRGIALLEFLPRVPLMKYCVRTLIRYDSGAESRPEAGLYWSYSDYPIVAGLLRFTAALTFVDSGTGHERFRDKKGRRSPLVRFFSIHDDPQRLYVEGRCKITNGPRDGPLPRIIPVEERPFRELTVEMRPTGVMSYWRDDAASERRLCAELSHKRLAQLVRDVSVEGSSFASVPGLEVKQLHLPADGAVGILSRDSTVTIRRFVIEPLQAEATPK